MSTNVNMLTTALSYPPAK